MTSRQPCKRPSWTSDAAQAKRAGHRFKGHQMSYRFRVNDWTGLDLPSARATESTVPQVPAGTDPAQPGVPALRFQDRAATCGTPCANRTGLAAVALAGHAEESHKTWPCRVTTTRTSEAPNARVQLPGAVDTAYTSN